jgi:hypothetical protein
MENKRWLTICWEDKFDELENIKLNDKDVYEGILLIKPPFADITLSDGFWQNLNNKFGKMFDMGEEEEIEANILPDIITEITLFSKTQYSKKGNYEVKIGTQLQPEKKEIFENISFDELREIIKKIGEFLLDADTKKKNITVML